MQILIGADIVPTASNIKEFSKAQLNSIVDEKLIHILKKADYRIFDLECVLTNSTEHITKCGPHLTAPPEVVNGFKELNVDMFTLANNHIMDVGARGFYDTVRILENNGIRYVGAGKNSYEAAKPQILSGDCVVGIYACAEHEFSIVSDDCPGANPIDLLSIFDDIRKLRDKVDFVIVLYHGGREHYRFPTPRLQKVCRKLIDAGSNLVITQHSHCVGCEENYKDGTIVYGQGNFIFDKSENEFRNSGLLIEVECRKKDSIALKYIPLEKDGKGVRYGIDSSILSGFAKRSMDIREEKFVEERFNEEAHNFSSYYLQACHGKKTFFNRLLCKVADNRIITKAYSLVYGKKEKTVLLDYIQCETHLEMLQNVLRTDIFK